MYFSLNRDIQKLERRLKAVMQKVMRFVCVRVIIIIIIMIIIGHSWNCSSVAKSVVSLSYGKLLRHNQCYPGPVEHLTTGENQFYNNNNNNNIHYLQRISPGNTKSIRVVLYLHY